MGENIEVKTTPTIQLISDFIQEEEEEEEEALSFGGSPSKKSNVGRPPPPPQRGGGGGGGVFQAKREEKGNPSIPHTYRRVVLQKTKA